MLNAYQRPLFRQAGGPAGVAALPPPPPAGVASLPQQDPQALIEAMAQETGSEMEAVGQDYVINMVNRLDTAEDFKQVIDSLRGNEMPMEDRYGELAEYVGEEDAVKTPESVLAMVQPVIMMTEEGNVDSGIGELMQGVAGEVDMMTEDGQLTDMGQGVGSLMAANQGPPPPQQFADGGGVQHLFTGGVPFAGTPGKWGHQDSSAGGILRQMPDGSLVPFTAQEWFSSPDFRVGASLSTSARGGVLRDPFAFKTDVQELYPEYRDLYRGIVDPEQERKMTKSGILFDVAKAGLDFASGIDPGTGESTGGGSMAERLTSALKPLPDKVGARVAAGRKAEQAVDLMALDTAIKQSMGERQLEAQLYSAQDIARLRLEFDTISDKGTRADMIRHLSNPTVLEMYGSGEPGGQYLETAIADIYTPYRDPKTEEMVYPEIPRSLLMAGFLRMRAGVPIIGILKTAVIKTFPEAADFQIPTLTLAKGGPVQHFQMGSGVQAISGGTPSLQDVVSEGPNTINLSEVDPNSFTFILKADGSGWSGIPEGYNYQHEAKLLTKIPVPEGTVAPVPNISQRLAGLDVTKGTGPWTGVAGAGNYLMGMLSEFFTGTSTMVAPEYSLVGKAIDAVELEMRQTISNSVVDRDTTQQQTLSDLVSLPRGAFIFDSSALDSFIVTRGYWQNIMDAEEAAIADPVLTGEIHERAKQNLVRMKQVAVELDTIIQGYEAKYSTGEDIDLSRFHRAPNGQ